MSGSSYPWLQDNVKRSYPFLTPVQPDSLKKIFVDAYIVDAYGEEDDEVELTSFELTNATTATDIQLRYLTSGNDFFNSAPTYNVWDFGAWKVVAADSISEGKFFRVTMSTSDIPAYPYTLDKVIDSMEAVFSIRNYHKAPAAVRSITVEDGETETTYNLVQENIQFVPGYNVEFDVGDYTESAKVFDESPNRLRVPVTITTQPGLGQGLNPAECDEVVDKLRTLENIPPDADGNIIFDLSDNMRWKCSFTGTGAVISRNAGEVEFERWRSLLPVRRVRRELRRAASHPGSCQSVG